MTEDLEADGGEATPLDYGNMPRPETLKSLTDDEWNATPPSVRKAFVERDARSQNNHAEQLTRLTGEMNAMREMITAQSQNRGAEQPKPKAGGIEGMELSDLEAYHDRAEEVLAAARREPENAALQAEAAKLTPQVMRELMKTIAKKSVGVTAADIESLRAEFRKDKEAGQLNAALTNKIVSEFGAGSILPGNDLKIKAEKAYAEIQLAMKDGLTSEAALQYAAFKIAAGTNGKIRDGRSGGVEANGSRRLAENGSEDIAGILRGLSTGAAALRAKGDEFGALKLDLEKDVLRGLPVQFVNGSR